MSNGMDEVKLGPGWMPLTKNTGLSNTGVAPGVAPGALAGEESSGVNPSRGRKVAQYYSKAEILALYKANPPVPRFMQEHPGVTVKDPLVPINLSGSERTTDSIATPASRATPKTRPGMFDAKVTVTEHTGFLNPPKRRGGAPPTVEVHGTTPGFPGSTTTKRTGATGLSAAQGEKAAQHWQRGTRSNADSANNWRAGEPKSQPQSGATATTSTVLPPLAPTNRRDLSALMTKQRSDKEREREKSTTATTSSITNDSKRMWCYKDPQGDVQGPFSAAQLMEWLKAGFYSDELPVRRTEEKNFRPLAVAFKLRSDDGVPPGFARSEKSTTSPDSSVFELSPPTKLSESPTEYTLPASRSLRPKLAGETDDMIRTVPGNPVQGNSDHHALEDQFAQIALETEQMNATIREDPVNAARGQPVQPVNDLLPDFRTERTMLSSASHGMMGAHLSNSPAVSRFANIMGRDAAAPVPEQSRFFGSTNNDLRNELPESHGTFLDPLGHSDHLMSTSPYDAKNPSPILQMLAKSSRAEEQSQQQAQNETLMELDPAIASFGHQLNSREEVAWLGPYGNQAMPMPFGYPTSPQHQEPLAFQNPPPVHNHMPASMQGQMQRSAVPGPVMDWHLQQQSQQMSGLPEDLALEANGHDVALSHMDAPAASYIDQPLQPSPTIDDDAGAAQESAAFGADVMEEETGASELNDPKVPTYQTNHKAPAMGLDELRPGGDEWTEHANHEAKDIAPPVLPSVDVDVAKDAARAQSEGVESTKGKLKKSKASTEGVKNDVVTVHEKPAAGSKKTEKSPEDDSNWETATHEQKKKKKTKGAASPGEEQAPSAQMARSSPVHAEVSAPVPEAGSAPTPDGTAKTGFEVVLTDYADQRIGTKQPKQPAPWSSVGGADSKPSLREIQEEEARRAEVERKRSQEFAREQQAMAQMEAAAKPSNGSVWGNAAAQAASTPLVDILREEASQRTKADKERKTKEVVQPSAAPAPAPAPSVPVRSGAWGAVAAGTPSLSLREQMKLEEERKKVQVADTHRPAAPVASGWAGRVAAGVKPAPASAVAPRVASAPRSAAPPMAAAQPAAAAAPEAREEDPELFWETVGKGGAVHKPKTVPTAILSSGSGPVTGTATAKIAPAVALTAHSTAMKKQDGAQGHKTVENAFGTTMSVDFTRWCQGEMKKLTGSSDITLPEFLFTLSTAWEIKEYVGEYLGSNEKTRAFADEFVRRKTFEAGDGAQPKPSNAGWSTVGSEDSGSKKKNRKQRGTKLDAAIVGLDD